jgi:uncharacterized protein
MINVLKEMILDTQRRVIYTGIKRDLKVSFIKSKATVCIGVRRCGKSTYSFQIMEKLIKSGVKKENILYINFFDNRIHSIDKKGLSDVTEAYFSIYPQKKNAETVYCFFDEIQEVEGWESFVERILRTEKCEVFITGSSAKMLSKEIATQMRGRALSWELFPFSFNEYLRFSGVNYQVNLAAKERLIVQKVFEQYWECGGFPEVAGLSKQLRIKIHQEYFNAILFKDLIERHNISHPKAVKDLAQWLIDNNASLYSINNLTGYLKALGHTVPKSAVSEYLDFFEDAYFLFTVKIFDASLARKNTNPKKIYCIDHSFANSVSSGILHNIGHLLENLVYITLRRRTPDIHYYKTKSGKEVDFIAKNSDKKYILVQVCETLVDPQTKKRETASLIEAMSEMEIKSSFIVTKETEETIETESGVINVMPIWKFLLEMDKE